MAIGGRCRTMCPMGRPCVMSLRPHGWHICGLAECWCHSAERRALERKRAAMYAAVRADQEGGQHADTGVTD